MEPECKSATGEIEITEEMVQLGGDLMGTLVYDLWYGAIDRYEAAERLFREMARKAPSGGAPRS